LFALFCNRCGRWGINWCTQRGRSPTCTSPEQYTHRECHNPLQARRPTAANTAPPTTPALHPPHFGAPTAERHNPPGAAAGRLEIGQVAADLVGGPRSGRSGNSCPQSLGNRSTPRRLKSDDLKNAAKAEKGGGSQTRKGGKGGGSQTRKGGEDEGPRARSGRPSGGKCLASLWPSTRRSLELVQLVLAHKNRSHLWEPVQRSPSTARLVLRRIIHKPISCRRRPGRPWRGPH